ncbi:MAG TPA: hypothetical protein VEL28_20500, partial [Candidatus Binatia bacterium]|nr:hypothetical protein [Candidatus Binatia bacterium]
MSTISAQAQRILDILIRRLPQIVPGEPQTYIGYKEIHDDLELSMAGQTYGDSLKHQGLEELAMWTVANELPAITGLIVDRTTFMPGDGYFRAFGRPTDDFGWWAKEVVKSKQFAWTPYSSAIVPPAPPIASDILQPPRIETTTFRILRDTALARRIKLLHNFQCQVCGATIILRDGTRYAEA